MFKPTGSKSCLKCRRKQLNVSSDRPVEPGIELWTPGTMSFLIVCGLVPWLYQHWPGGFMVLWFYVQEHPKAQLAVVLVLKRLRRQGNGLKSHPTDWEKPGIKPATRAATFTEFGKRLQEFQ